MLANYSSGLGGVGEIECAGTNNTVFNNIAVVNPTLNEGVTAIHGSGNNTFGYNILCGRTEDNGSATAPGTLVLSEATQIGFVNPSINASAADFRLLSWSMAVDAGLNEQAASVDIEGTARPCNGTADIGCFEFCAVSAVRAFDRFSACTVHEQMTVHHGAACTSAYSPTGRRMRHTTLYNICAAQILVHLSNGGSIVKAIMRNYPN